MTLIHLWCTCGFPIKTSRIGKWRGRPSTMLARQTPANFRLGEPFGRRLPRKAGCWNRESPRRLDQFPGRDLEPSQAADFLHSHDPAHQLDFLIQHVHREIDRSLMNTGCSQDFGASSDYLFRNDWLWSLM